MTPTINLNNIDNSIRSFIFLFFSFFIVESGLMIRKMMMESLVDHETHNKLQHNAAYNKHKHKSMK